MFCRFFSGCALIGIAALLTGCGGSSTHSTNASQLELSGRPRIAEPLRQGLNALHLDAQGPAKVNFAADFPTLYDWEWGFELGGFGGVQQGAQLSHIPVIFIHGNTTDHADWYVVRDDFRDAGWSDQSLWALSYNGLGTNSGGSPLRSQPERDAEHQEMGWDNTSRSTNNDLNVEDLVDYILAVQTYTGQKCFSLVGHSLGVTVARKTLKTYPEFRPYLVGFVGIAGGNHGSSLCPPGSATALVSCDELEKDSAWLDSLNGNAGSDETYAPGQWLTIYDGSGLSDFAFNTPLYAQSPRLQGADNREYPLVDHNGLRISPEIIAEYRLFLEQAEQDMGGLDASHCQQ